jgi:WhiB family redox-sensing transcriptional regulator
MPTERDWIAHSSDWTARAACVNEDPDLFFPISEHSQSGLAQVHEALGVCAVCEVVTQCLDLALSIGTPWGVWGGQTAMARERIKRRSADAKRRRRLARILNTDAGRAPELRTEIDMARPQADVHVS